MSLTRPEPPEKKIPIAKPKPDTMMLNIVKVFILFKNYTQVYSKVCKKFDSDELRLGFNYTFKFLQKGNNNIMITKSKREIIISVLFEKVLDIILPQRPGYT